MSRIPIQNLTEEQFRPYGCIISHQFANPTGRDWQVVAKTESTGWCIGILELKRDVCPYLERHLDSRQRRMCTADGFAGMPGTMRGVSVGSAGLPSRKSLASGNGDFGNRCCQGH